VLRPLRSLFLMFICVRNIMADLLAGALAAEKITLPADVLLQEEQFLDELLRWNKRINLTSITDRYEALEKHLLDSLLLLRFLTGRGRLLDMGSGAGLPGIPLAIACRDLEVVSVDSVGKKVNFQKHVKRKLSLENLQPVHARLETLHGLELFDLVVARALSGFKELIEWSAPLIKSGGELYVMKGREGSAELESFLVSDDRCLFKVKATHHYLLPYSKSDRQLTILSRTAH